MGHPNPYIEEILRLEPLKTWSLIVTIFGDFDGDTLTGTQLRLMLEPLGIKPEAIRVALHRLKADGWITAKKTGREAHYKLSALGRRETEAVRADVYGQNDTHPDGWRLVLPGHASDIDVGIPLGRDARLVPASMAATLGDVWCLDLDTAAIPPWVETALVPSDLLQTAKVLAAVLDKARARFDDMAPADMLALRLLTLHHWRRLALRSGTWAHLSLFEHGSISQTRNAVIDLLQQSPRISL